MERRDGEDGRGGAEAGLWRAQRVTRSGDKEEVPGDRGMDLLGFRLP